MSIAEGFRKPPSQEYGAAIARFYQGITVAGTGFRVAEHYILTCAHVVSQCLFNQKSAEGILRVDVIGKSLEIDFPVNRSKQRQTVEIIPELWRINGEDIAVLRLASPRPSGTGVITLKSDSSYWHHPFAVYGFPDKRSAGTWVTGELLGTQPSTGRVQAEGTKTEGLSIRPGFSGSPVWDETLGGVVGMTVARDKEEPTKIGFMIPYQTLKPALEAIALFALLLPDKTEVLLPWQSAFNFAQPKFQALQPDYPASLEAAIVQVQNLPEPEVGQYRAIDRFVAYLAAQNLPDSYKLKLCEWLKKQASVPDRDAFLSEVKSKLEATSAKSSTHHLLFWVQGEFYSDRYCVQAYLVKDRHQVSAPTPLKAPDEYLRGQTD